MVAALVHKEIQVFQLIIFALSHEISGLHLERYRNMAVHIKVPLIRIERKEAIDANQKVELFFICSKSEHLKDLTH